MTEQNNNQNKLTTQPTQPTQPAVTNKRSFGLPALHRKAAEAAAAPATDASTLSNRIALMLDCSSSMTSRGTSDDSKSKIEFLREAIMSFVNNVNFVDTGIALECFPAEEERRLALTNQYPILITTIMSLNAHGSTPMAQAMDFVLDNYSVTRCVIVSDGEADRHVACIETAKLYAENETPIDCVHIGSSSQGEALLKEIAEITGGKYIKFSDVASFGRNFKYLTPAFYGALTSGSVDALALGAKEIK